MKVFSDFLVLNIKTAVSMISKNEIVNTCFNSFSSLTVWNALLGLSLSVAGQCHWNQVSRYVNLPFDIDNEILKRLFKLFATHCFVN